MCITDSSNRIAYYVDKRKIILSVDYIPMRFSVYSLGGLILDFAVGNYNGIAVFQPVINGECDLQYLLAQYD